MRGIVPEGIREHGQRCTRCDCPFDEWTPRCETCRERHRNRARRRNDEALLARYHALAKLNHEASWQDVAQRTRDGEFSRPPYWGANAHLASRA